MSELNDSIKDESTDMDDTDTGKSTNVINDISDVAEVDSLESDNFITRRETYVNNLSGISVKLSESLRVSVAENNRTGITRMSYNSGGKFLVGEGFNEEEALSSLLNNMFKDSIITFFFKEL